MWPNYPVTEPVETAFKLRQRFKKNYRHVLTSPENFEFGNFTLLFGRARWRNVPNFITHVQGLCFSHYILLFCDDLVAVAVVAS